MGTCVYHIAHRGIGQTLGTTGQNVELPKLHSGALRSARTGHDAHARRGHTTERYGIVGVRLEEKSHQWGSHTIEFLSLGTAVLKTSDEVTLAKPTTIITLDN